MFWKFCSKVTLIHPHGTIVYRGHKTHGDTMTMGHVGGNKLEGMTWVGWMINLTVTTGFFTPEDEPVTAGTCHSLEIWLEDHFDFYINGWLVASMLIFQGVMFKEGVQKKKKYAAMARFLFCCWGGVRVKAGNVNWSSCMETPKRKLTRKLKKIIQPIHSCSSPLKETLREQPADQLNG